MDLEKLQRQRPRLLAQRIQQSGWHIHGPRSRHGQRCTYQLHDASIWQVLRDWTPQKPTHREYKTERQVWPIYRRSWRARLLENLQDSTQQCTKVWSGTRRYTWIRLEQFRSSFLWKYMLWCKYDGRDREAIKAFEERLMVYNDNEETTLLWNVLSGW